MGRPDESHVDRPPQVVTWRRAPHVSGLLREGQSGISTPTLTLDGLPTGDWSVLLVASFSDGKLTVTGQPDYFRVIVR